MLVSGFSATESSTLSERISRRSRHPGTREFWNDFSKTNFLQRFRHRVRCRSDGSAGLEDGTAHLFHSVQGLCLSTFHERWRAHRNGRKLKDNSVAGRIGGRSRTRSGVSLCQMAHLQEHLPLVDCDAPRRRYSTSLWRHSAVIVN